MATPTAGARKRAAGLAVLVLVTVAVRVPHLLAVRPTPAFQFHRTFVESDMYLMDQWALRIAGGDLLSREPYLPIASWMRAIAPPEKWSAWTGGDATFYKAPFYAYLIAALRRGFGDPMLAMALLQIGAAVASVVLLAGIGTRLFGRLAGFCAAALLALYAPAVHYDAVLLRGPWVVLAALLVTWQLTRLRPAATLGRGFGLGVALGFALLVNEGFMTLVPLAAAALVWSVRGGGTLGRVAAGAVLGLTLVLTPVVARNLAVGVSPLRLAVTGTGVLALHNGKGVEPHFFAPPAGFLLRVMEASGGEFAKAALLCLRSFDGPLDVLRFYLVRLAGIVAPFENPDNANFYYAALRSPVLPALLTHGVVFPLAVLGGMMALRAPGRLVPLAPACLTLGLSLLITLPLSRYRVPLVACLLPLAGHALAAAASAARARRWAPLVAGIAAYAVFVGGGRMAGSLLNPGYVASLTYRGAEFSLATLAYEKEGRLAEAAAELHDFARLNPNPAIRVPALLNAAKLQIRAGDRSGARASLREAAAEAKDARTLLTIGDLLAQHLGEIEDARSTYEHAATLARAGSLADTARARARSLVASEAR